MTRLSAVLLVLFFLTFFAAVARSSTVVIDAGHGGWDHGGVPGQRIKEKNMTLDVARRLRSYLETRDIRTVMTRSDDNFVSLGERVRIANAQRSAIFVSVHFNSGQRPGAQGIETYFYGRSGRRLAQNIHARVVRGLGAEDRRVRQRGYFVLRRTRIPAVLVECGFLTNPFEGKLAERPERRQSIATKIGEGILATIR